ncbi:tyrosine-type recombinase/integrase [Streptomyces sp. NPDC059637]|uniref:tyrosine-type recombinase/integrase n=1 Tax=Streptomyces sp. NPDC059637 TaxID=3347752 RepID=UPI00369E885E
MRVRVRVRVHDLRHTCATLMPAEGVAVRTVMETLGHSTTSMTMDTYAHVLETTLRDAAARMDGLLGSGLGDEPGKEEDPPAAGVLALR